MNDYNLSDSFTEVIIQGEIRKSPQFPKLSELYQGDFTVTNITFLHSGRSAFEINDFSLDEAGEKIIHCVNKLTEDSLFVGEDQLDELDEAALSILRKMYYNNKIVNNNL